MTLPLLLAALAISAPEGGLPAKPSATGRFAAMSKEARGELLASAAARPFAERLLEVSAGFLGTPYVHSPLGEGEGPDPDPTFRLDAVDCLTFVEETLALAAAKGSEARLLPTLSALRYGAAPRYEQRNHLMEAQWLPNNVRRGFLREVTDRYGGADVVSAEKVIAQAAWQSKSSLQLQLPPAAQRTGSFGFRLLPLDKVMGHARQIPSGTVLIVVREDKPMKVTRVTHLGFVVQRGTRTYLRHAARNNYMRVIDEDLETFLTRNSRYEKWRVSGVSLYEPRERTWMSGRALDGALRLRLLFSRPGVVVSGRGQPGPLVAK